MIVRALLRQLAVMLMWRQCYVPSVALHYTVSPASTMPAAPVACCSSRDSAASFSPSLLPLNRGHLPSTDIPRTTAPFQRLDQVLQLASNPNPDRNLNPILSVLVWGRCLESECSYTAAGISTLYCAEPKQQQQQQQRSWTGRVLTSHNESLWLNTLICSVTFGYGFRTTCDWSAAVPLCVDLVSSSMHLVNLPLFEMLFRLSCTWIGLLSNCVVHLLRLS